MCKCTSQQQAEAQARNRWTALTVHSGSMQRALVRQAAPLHGRIGSAVLTAARRLRLRRSSA